VEPGNAETCDLENEKDHQISGSLCRLRQTLLQISGEATSQTADAFLELSILGGVDERIDTLDSVLEITDG